MQFVVLYLFTRFMLDVWWGGSVAATFAVAAGRDRRGDRPRDAHHRDRQDRARRRWHRARSFIQIQALIGGAFFSIAILPEWVQPIQYLSVVGWTMEGWRAVQVEGAGLAGVMVPVAALLGFAVAFYSFGVWRMRAEQ